MKKQNGQVNILFSVIKINIVKNSVEIVGIIRWESGFCSRYTKIRENHFNPRHLCSSPRELGIWG
jgi:hypothetical protein